jgi:D-amino-acid oxidase
MEILILGAGVNGLSCGIRLQEAGIPTQIWARDLPPDTTSNVAAAVWYPYKAFPEHLVDRWGARSFREFCELASDGASHVIVRKGIEIFTNVKTDDPWWRNAVSDFRHARRDELPEGYRSGYVFKAPVIEMPAYLNYLMRRFRDLGGQIERVQPLRDISETLARHDITINCTGLGARELVHDGTMYAARGQIVRIKQVGIQRFWLDTQDANRLTYIVPRTNDVVLGGTYEEGDERLAPDPTIAAAIIARCAKLEPRLKTLENDDILEHRVGLRPERPNIRLEVERFPAGKAVIHNYGHGGAGVTISWGCAEEVVHLVRQCDLER